MKASKIVTLILSFFIVAGIVGTVAVLSKNFTEIPEFILDTSETTVEHKDNSSSNASKVEEPITDSDINHIVYRECEFYTSSTTYTYGSRRELTQSKTDPGIFYAIIPTGDSIGRSGFWGIKAGFVLDSGKIKSWTYDLDGSKAKHPFNSNNPGLYTLICMSFFGDEPDLGIFSDVLNSTKFSDYVLTETIESNFDFKIYVFESSVAELNMEQITITGENDDYGYSSEQRYNSNYQDSQGSFVFSQLNFSLLDLDVTIKQTLSDGNELNYSWELSPQNVSGLSSLVILYSPNTIAISDQYDEYFGYEALIDSQTEITFGYLYFYGIFADYIEGTSLESVECTGLYKISLTRDDFLHLSDQTGNLLLIDNDQNVSRDNDVQFFLRKISTIIDGNTYDEWNGGELLDNPLAASSLEIHQNGTEIETQITGKNDSSVGDWYIDGHITPPEVNYTLEIVIKITSIGSQSYYTSNFLNHTIFIDDVQSFNMIFNLTDSVINVTYGDGTSGNISQSGTVENIVSVNSVSYAHSEERVTNIVDSNNVVVKTITGDTTSINYAPTTNGYKVVSSSYQNPNCLSVDTNVMMADGTTKKLGDIEVGDEVLSIDFDTMKLVSRKVIYSGRDEPDYDDWVVPFYYENVYSDGTIVKQCMRHRLYNLEDEGYKHLFTWATGEHGYKLDGTNPTLVERRIVNTPQRYARITLEGSNNWFAEGMSTGDSECPSGIILDHALQRAGE